MKPKKYFAAGVTVLAGAAFLIPSLQARTCSGNGDLVGSYGFAGSRGGYYLLGATAAATGSPAGTGPMIPVSATPPGTTTVTSQAFVGSNTPIGSLVAGLNNPNVFASAGRLFLDGMGNAYASPTVGLVSNFMAGAYNVESDCSVTLTLYDPFQTGTAPGTTPTDTNLQTGKITLQGFIVNSAQEVDLVETTSTAAGATLTLSRTAQSGSCTDTSLSGNYTIFGTGMYFPPAGTGILMSGGTTTGGTTTTTTATPGTVPGAFFSGITAPLGTPFNLLGRFVADGNGNFVTDTSAQSSPLTAGFSGTYTVNADCTGNARLTDQNGVTRNINFVLVNVAQSSGGTVAQSSAGQQLEFAFSDPGVIGSGTAAPQ